MTPLKYLLKIFLKWMTRGITRVSFFVGFPHRFPTRSKNVIRFFCFLTMLLIHRGCKKINWKKEQRLLTMLLILCIDHEECDEFNILIFNFIAK